MKDGKINNHHAKKRFKTLEDIETSKIHYSRLVNKSGDNKYVEFVRFGPLYSFFSKLINVDIGIDVINLNIEEFENKIDTLKDTKTKKIPTNK